MTKQTAIEAIELIGKTVKLAHGSERWAMAKGQPQAGRVEDIYFPDIDHPYVVVQWPNNIDHHYLHELEVVNPTKLSDNNEKHLKQLAPHVKERDSARLLRAALARINTLESALRDTSLVNPMYGEILPNDPTEYMITGKELYKLQRALSDKA